MPAFLRASIYARYSSENQRRESIEDQVLACRVAAKQRDFVVLEDHVYTDHAKSGAIATRPGLIALCEAAKERSFDVVLVDDLSRLARDNALMLLLLNDLEYNGVRVVSVADHLDTGDEHALLGIQVRGVFNELLLSDLRKRTFRGQLGQKKRGFFVGEATFGYRSEAAGAVTLDKHGRPRPEGYVMRVAPAEAEVVLRIFREAAEGIPFTRITKRLNADHVPGRIRSACGWTVGSIRRTLENSKYRGHWVWNKRGNRRDRRTGRRRYVDKPESEWVVRDDEALRIVPQELWDRVAERLREIQKVWPGGKGRGFGPGQRSRVHAYPPYLLSGAMVCGCCDRAIALVSGHRGGYYGCSAAARHACSNRVRVPRRVAEKVILGALRDRLLQPEPVSRVLDRVREEVSVLCAHVPDMLKRKAAQLDEARRRVARIVNFVALRPPTRACAFRRAPGSRSVWRQSVTCSSGARRPPGSCCVGSWAGWFWNRCTRSRERRTTLRAPRSTVLVLLEPLGSDPGSESGANSFGWWRRRVLHSGPQRAWGSRYLGQLPPATQSAAATGHVNSLGIDLATVDDTWREVGGTVADRTAEVAVGMASPRAELLCVGARRGPTPPATHRGRRTRHRRGDRLAGVTVVPGRPRTQGAAAGTVRAAVRGCRRQAVVSGGGTFPAARAPIRHAAAA